jgi:AraC-like DNA-binding protein
MNHSPIALLQELLKCGTDIPVWHYDMDGHLLDTNSAHLVLDKILGFIGGIRYMLEFAQKSRKPLVLGSDMGLMWCAVYEADKEHINSIYLIGPVFNTEIGEAFLEESANRYQIDPAFRRQYLRILKGISVVPSLLFQQYCLMLHYCVNGEKLNRSDIHYQPRNKILLPIPTAADSDDCDRLNAYQTEQALLRMIREGDVQYKKVIVHADHLFNALNDVPGRLLPAAITEATGFVTLCIREAITAGISADTAFAVGEGYMESMRQCRTVSELASLNLTMYEDFIFRVRKHRTNPTVSPQIRSCRDYIELHAEQELKLANLAKQVGYSEYYLSRKFKLEMGICISGYIRLIRVERSKLMLSTTSTPIHQIAASLHFASSSHFSEAFREIVGKTPQQYRIDNQAY